jgi:hypothetical protein
VGAGFRKALKAREALLAEVDKSLERFKAKP